ncbi:MAG: M15 family metallopeptidase [Succinivibrio sp.]
MANTPWPERCSGLDGSFCATSEEFPGIAASAGALKALSDLRADALSSGFDLRACSGWRSFERQAAIVTQKLEGKRPILGADEKPVDASRMDLAGKLEAALRFSALPGFSRHHFGTDFDIYAANLIPQGGRLELTCREYDEGMYFHEFGKWLSGALERHGFARPFTGRGGISREPWHVSYLPEAEQCLAAFSFERSIKALEDSGLFWSALAVEFATRRFPALFS